MNIICFSNIDWDFLFQRHQHLMISLLKTGKIEHIFFVETMGTRNIKLTLEDLKRATNKIFSKIRINNNNVNEVKKKYPNLHIVTPKFIPIFKQPFFTINELILKKQLIDLFKKNNVKFSDTIAWTMLQHPTIFKLIKNVNFKKTVFDCIDDIESFPDVKKLIIQTEKKIIKTSDLVTVTSNNLYEHCKKYNQNIYMLKNAVDEKLIKKINIPKEKKRTIGYIGTVYEWFDLEIIEYLLKQKQDINIEIIGPVRIQLENLKKYNNIKFLGKLPYEKIEEKIENFDVCLIPFKLNKLTLNTNPVKLYEYFSKGKPVVSSCLPELYEYKDYLYMYSNKKEFLKCIDLALKENSYEIMLKRQKVAKENTWQKRAEYILKILKLEGVCE